MGNTTTRENFQGTSTGLLQALGGKPIPCPPGTYGGSTGQSTNQCSGKCSAGYYCTQASTSPTQYECPPGYYCLEGTGDPLSQNRPAACIAGTTSGLRATSCTACGDGTSSIAGGQCTPCLANTYSVNPCGAIIVVADADSGPPATTSPGGPVAPAPAGIQMWYDGNDPLADGNTPQDGMSVSSWKDKSGNGYHAATKAGPKARVNVQNGLSVMEFNSNTNAKVTYPLNPNLFQEVLQVFVVCKSTNGTDDGVSTPISFGVESQFDPWNKSRYLDNHQRGIQSPNSLYNRTISIFSALVNQGSSTYYKEWLNGAQVTSFIEGNPNGFGRITNTNTLYIAQRGDGATHWNGYIHEMAIYNVELSTADQQKVEGYLAWKWGFQTSLSPSHPYRTTPPEITMLTSPPFKPTGLIASNTATGVSVSWLGGGGGTSYTITLTGTLQTFTSTVTGTNLTTGTVNGVLPGYTYAVLVRAINKFGSTLSDSISISIPNITVKTVAGAMGSTLVGVDGLNGSAFIYKPMSIVANSCGSLFVADGNHYIRKIYLQGDNSSAESSSAYPIPSIVTTFAGSSVSGFVNTGTSNSIARFNNPQSLAIDSADVVYVADTYNHAIRKITPQGVVTTLAGSGSVGNTNATGTSATFRYPTGIAVDSAGNVYVADKDNHLIRKITAAGVVTTLAGSGTMGSADATGINATFRSPWGLATDSTGNIFVADSDNHTIRRITPAGAVTTIAGIAGSTGTTDGVGACARFNSPVSLAFDSNGSLYVCERFSNLIRKIALSSGLASGACVVSEKSIIATVTTIAGSGTAGYGNGMGRASQFNTPYGICFDSTGVLYVADTINNVIRGITILPAPPKSQPSSCATLCKPCCPGTLSPVGANICTPYPGFIINITRSPYAVKRGFYQNDTNGIWAGYFTTRLPTGLTGNMVLSATGQFDACTLHLFPGWIAFGYLNKNPVSKMVLDPAPYRESSSIRATTYVLVVLSESEVTYTTGTDGSSLVPNVVTPGSGLPIALPLFVCGDGSTSC